MYLGDEEPRFENRANTVRQSSSNLHIRLKICIEVEMARLHQ